MSFKRKLLALGHPSVDKFDVRSEEMFRALVAWLEDMKIR